MSGAGVGERTREGNDLLREMIESGVIRYGEEFKKSKMCIRDSCSSVGTSASLVRMRSPVRFRPVAPSKSLWVGGFPVIRGSENRLYFFL